MILQALSDYYQRMVQDQNSQIAEFGFSRQNIAFCVVLNPDGTLHSIRDEREDDGKRQTAKSVVVLGNSKPSGSGINPCFLWDNAAYMLGYKPDDSKPERTRQSFEEFRQHHLNAEADIDHPDFSAVCRFLESWNPDEAASHETLTENPTGFGVFAIRAQTGYIHERPKIWDHWLRQFADDNSSDVTGQCLVTGRTSPLARLHEPKIKGVNGAQSAGALLVSFNADAFESYGKSQSFNAPVAERTAFQYATALNTLLQRDSRQRIQIGDASTVFWTDGYTKAEEFFGRLIERYETEDEATKLEVQTVLQQIANGAYPDELGKPETTFYILGLSPNAARVSVRFWEVSNLDEMISRLRRHFNDLQVERLSDRDPEFPTFWQLLRETARETKDIPPLLSGALMRAILGGANYPDVLYHAVLRRIRADRQVNYLRAAMLKAYLNRNKDKELSVSLDPVRPEPAYHLGRLFAALEKAQEEALPGINATIKDRYFSSASASPAGVFPRLIRMNQHHVGKIERRDYRLTHEKRIQEIMDRLDGFPAHLNLNDQGLFAVGYYHQRKDIFTKKDNSTTEEN